MFSTDNFHDFASARQINSQINLLAKDNRAEFDDMLDKHSYGILDRASKVQSVKLG